MPLTYHMHGPYLTQPPPTMPPQAGAAVAPGDTPPTMSPQAGSAAVAAPGAPPGILASWQPSALLAQRCGSVWLPVCLTQCCKQGPDDEHTLRLQLRLRLDGELQQSAVWIQVCVACVYVNPLDPTPALVTLPARLKHLSTVGFHVGGWVGGWGGAYVIIRSVGGGGGGQGNACPLPTQIDAPLPLSPMPSPILSHQS